MSNKLFKRKIVIVTAGLVMIVALLAGVAYYRHNSRTNCISYYDKDGKELLYQDCK